MASINVGDKCTVHVDYGNRKLLKNKRVRIEAVQTHGRQTFYKVKWLGVYGKECEAEFGTLFEESSLRRVKK
jgi:hypothetical protein